MEDTNILNVAFWEYSDIQRPMKMEQIWRATMEDTNILNVAFWEYSDIQRPMKMEQGEPSSCIKFTAFAG